MINKNVIIIGAGVAGMEAASVLSAAGYDVVIIEKEKEPGGHVRLWAHLFPTKRTADEVYYSLEKKIEPNIIFKNGTVISGINRLKKGFEVKLQDGLAIYADAILITTGFSLFDARRKEEYGYGIYDNVITSAELEERFKSGESIRTDKGKIPEKIGIVHCVGSRDEKMGNCYCSAVCCITGVKQAIELRKELPETEVFNFYMDLRLHGNHYEDFYREAQEEWGIQFIRGRLSEAAETQGGALRIKVEDTLIGRPLGITVDMLVLLAGMEPATGTETFVQMLGVEINEDGFFNPADEHLEANRTNIQGVFVAGTCTGPKCIRETLADARAAACEIDRYLKDQFSENKYLNTIVHERLGI